MIWTRQDDEALRQCRYTCVEGRRRFFHPAPWFPAFLRMYEELEQHGLIQRVDDEYSPLPLELDKPLAPEIRDLCDGCYHQCNGGCLIGYRSAELSGDRKRVIDCPERRPDRSG